MAYVQVVLTDDHVRLLREGVGNLVVDPEGEPDRAAEVMILESFLDSVSQHPEAFPPTGRMAKSIKHRMRLLKGPSQPQSRRNKRKARQERRQSTSKRRRRERKEFVAQYNAARERMEAERLEADEAYRAQTQELLDSLRGQTTFTSEEIKELFGLDVEQVVISLENVLRMLPAPEGE